MVTPLSKSAAQQARPDCGACRACCGPCATARRVADFRISARIAGDPKRIKTSGGPRPSASRTDFSMRTFLPESVLLRLAGAPRIASRLERGDGGLKLRVLTSGEGLRRERHGHVR